MSEEAKKTPVCQFNLESADGIPRKDEITVTTSSDGGVDIQSHSPITPLPRSDSIDGIPREDEFSIKNSSKGGLDIMGHSPAILPNNPSLESADGIPREDEITVTTSSDEGVDIQNHSPITHLPRGIPNIVTTLILGCAGKSSTAKEPFYLDSGATKHATGNRKLISQLTTDKAGILLKTANGGSLWSHGCGYVITEDYTLANVHYVPGLDTNVVSVSELNDLDYNLDFTRNGCIIKDGRTSNLVGKGIRGVSGLFELDSLKVPLDRTKA